MRVDGKLTERKEKVEKSEPSSQKNMKRQKKAASTPSPVQRLFDTCKEMLADGGSGTIPSPDNVQRLRSVIDTLRPEYLGLSPNLSDFINAAPDGQLPPITYLHLYACSNFSIGIFCLPKGAVIPLHNHPGMIVCSKILLGSMHIKSYDWVTSTQNSNEKIKTTTGACLAKVKTDAIFTAPCETSVLYPTSGGNLHCFTAVTSCAVLDVFVPPYNDDEGRPCTYFKEHAYSTFPGAAGPVSCESKEYAWLEARDGQPEEHVVRGAEYKGQKIVDY